MSKNKDMIRIQNTNQDVTGIFFRLNEMRHTLELIDCSLKTDDGTVFPTHKILLLAASSYFLKYFRENRRLPVLLAIHDIKPNVMKLMIDFMYFQPVEIPLTLLWELLAAAEKCEFSTLVQQCRRYFQENLNAGNCALVYQRSKLYNSSELQSMARRFVIKHFDQIPTDNENLLNLTADELRDLLMDDGISCREERLWTVVKLWLEKSPKDRRMFAPQMLSCIRLGFLDTCFIFENIMKHPVIFSDEECQNLVTKKLDLMWDMAKMQSLTHVETKYIARPRLPSDLLFNVKTVSNEDGVGMDIIEVYDHKADIWSEVQEERDNNNNNINRTGHACVFLENCLYVVGGRDLETGFVYNTVNCFDLLKREWCNVPPMNKPRYGMSVAVCDGFIFVMGGSLETHIIYSVETFEPKDQRWSFTSSLKKSRCFASAATLGQRIYVTGGTSNHLNSLRSAEAFNMATCSWSQIANMKEARRGLSSVSSKEQIFVAGGSDTTTVERYDPKYNSWTIVSQMREPRSFFTLAILDGVMYAIGGVKGDKEKQLDEPSGSEVYHEDTQTWRPVTKSIHTTSVASSSCVATALPNAHEFLYKNRQNVLEVKRKLHMESELKKHSIENIIEGEEAIATE